jgi:hypothetical protein
MPSQYLEMISYTELHLPKCSRKKPREPLSFKVVIPAIIAATFITVVLCSLSNFCMVRKLTRHFNAPVSEE